MNIKDEFVRWKIRGKWTRWHLKRPGNEYMTRCGLFIRGDVQMKDTGYCDCAVCAKHEAIR